MNQPYDSTQDTLDHIEKVRGHLADASLILFKRGVLHDQSKLESPEKEIFDAITPQLKGLTYGSDEYKAGLAEMGEALQHHYAHNAHHPEHHEEGIAGMNLFDLVEMVCDWKAASERHAPAGAPSTERQSDFAKSLAINQARFGISDQLARILENTRLALDW